MFRHFTTVLVSLLALSATIGNYTDTDENIQLRIFNRRFQSSPAVICKLLKRADLENNGYKKDVISKLVKEAGSGKSDFQTAYFYYKLVNCTYSAMRQIGQELNASLPGAIGKEMSIKVREEMKFRRLNDAGLCKMGLEVYFADGMGCDMQRRKREDGAIRNEATRAVSPRRPGVKVGLNIRIRVRVRVRVRVGWKR